jgi:hypothetical protein
VNEFQPLKRENTSFVDAEEIDSLVKGIEYIAKINRNVTSFQTFEVEYRTKGDLRIIVFDNEKGEISASIESGRVGPARALIDLLELEAFRKLILEAKGKL